MALPSCVFCLFCCLPRLPGNQASVQACCGVSKQLIFPWAGPADDEDDGGGDNEDDDDDDDSDGDDDDDGSINNYDYEISPLPPLGWSRTRIMSCL